MISEKIFCQIIENLRQQIYKDRLFGEALKEAINSKNRCVYDNSLLIKSIMTLLHTYFPKDSDGECKIEFYCFVLEFGRVSSEELITPEDLYHELVKNL